MDTADNSTKGFTLLEVMLAVCILAMFLVPLLGAVQGGIRNLGRARSMQIARHLAINKLQELNVMAIPEMDQELNGNFAPGHPEYQWRMIYTKNPQLQLLETQVPGLQTMEVQVIIFWPEGDDQRELAYRTLVAK